ncbi:MAG: outer membrane beta-barrel protein [Fimbriimonadaceae bacterium]|nr:outer membrane beta-barrel protein [Fimbriimonadaceae bacterium]
MTIRRTLELSFCILAIGVSAMASAREGDTGKGTNIGIRSGVYFPTNSEIRDIFGSDIIVVGLSFDDFSKQADNWKIKADFDFITGKDGSNKFFAMPVTASIGQVYGKPGDSSRPFVRFGAGTAYFDYSITRPSNSTRYSSKRFGFSADAEVGVIVGNKLRLSAKYVWLSKVDDFDFSGLQLTVTYNILKF